MNECRDGNGGCAHICENTQFSYTCSCRDGYTLSDDGHNCTGKKTKLVQSGMILEVLFYLQQILTNALSTLMDVNMSVSTVMDHTHVNVEMDMLWMATGRLAPLVVEEESRIPVEVSRLQIGQRDILKLTLSASGLLTCLLTAPLSLLSTVQHME